MSIPRESAPIEATQNGIGYSLVFLDDEPDEDTVLMIVTIDSGEVYEERVCREAADSKLKTLVEDQIDARLHEILSTHAAS